jgi:hypothetical protein
MNSAMNGKIPSIDQCYKLVKKCRVPHHIVSHCEMVCNVAVFLAEEADSTGYRCFKEGEEKLYIIWIRMDEGKEGGFS